MIGVVETWRINNYYTKGFTRKGIVNNCVLYCGGARQNIMADDHGIFPEESVDELCVVVSENNDSKSRGAYSAFSNSGWAHNTVIVK